MALYAVNRFVKKRSEDVSPRDISASRCMRARRLHFSMLQSMDSIYSSKTAAKGMAREIIAIVGFDSHTNYRSA